MGIEKILIFLARYCPFNYKNIFSGIHASEKEGCMSLVLSGGYEDDVDNGDEFTYTGSGGRELKGE